MVKRGNQRINAALRASLAAAGISFLLAGCSGGVGDTAAGILGLKTASEKDEQGDIVLYTRSPLVLPPDYNLRAPSSEEQEKQQLGANWPNDPDVRAREVAALERKQLRESDKATRGEVVGREKALTPEELARGTVPAGTGGRPGASVVRAGERERALTPGELRQGGKDFELPKEDGQKQGQQPQVPVEQQTSTEQAENEAENQGEKKKSFFSRLNPFD